MNLQNQELPNDIRLLKLEGDLDVAGVATIESRLLADCGADRPRLLVDLSRTGFVASFGIRMLLLAIKTVSARGGRLLLLNPASAVASALEISGLGRFIFRGNEAGAAAELLTLAK